MRDFEQMMKQLDRVAIFNICSGEEKAELLDAFETAQYRMGETIIQQGEDSDALFILVSGKARVIGKLPSGEEKSMGLLGAGEHFGEQSLLRNEPSDTTISASTELIALKLHKDAFYRLLQLHPKLEKYFQEYMAHDGMRVFLQSKTVFSRLDAQTVRSLLDSFEIQGFEPGQALVAEGEPGDAFYILRTGSAVVVQGEERRLLNKLMPGDYFGELALLKGAARKASVIAEERSSAFRLDKHDFDILIREYPVISQTMERLASYYSEHALVSSDDAGEEIYLHDDAEAETAVGAASLSAKDRHEEKSGVGRSFSFRKIWRRLRYPALLQQSDMDCGPTCLVMIVRYYGGRISLNRMRALAEVSLSGTSLQNLADTAAALGFEAQGMRGSLSGLQDLALPCILHWGGNHYVVLYEVNRHDCVIADPAVGATETIPMEQFRMKWNGIALLLSPVDESVRKLRDEESLTETFAPFFKPLRGRLAYIVALTVGVQLILLTLPLLTQVIVDRVLVQRSESLLQIMLFALLALAFALGAGTYGRQLLAAKTALLLDRELVGAFYRKLFGLPYDYFVRRTVGDVMTRVGETATIRRLLTDHAAYLLLDVLALLIYACVMFAYNVKLAFISLAVLPVFGLLAAVVLPRMRRYSRKEQGAEGELQSALVESVHAVATVKALSAERIVERKLEEKLQATLALRMKGYLLGAWTDAASGFLQIVGNALLLYWGAQFVLAGELSVGELVAFNALFITMIHAVDSIVRMLDQAAEARTAMERLIDVLEARPEAADAKEMKMLPPIRGEIRFQDVSFRFDPEGRNMLENVTFQIAPGQSIALVGRSGSGKTTLIHLLLKLYQPTEGGIWVDGSDLRGVHPGSLRRQVGVVQQETVMFRGSIRDNIAFHHPNANMEEVESAAKLAGAHEFIGAFPLGYETMIGEGGLRLSGGQRQRIAIARALIGNPRLLIFDEATSALDTESEAAIQRNMEGMLHGRTTILIAHRLSTVRRADRILVLDKGRIVEQGTHDELLQRKGLYAYLISQQLE